MAQLRSVIPFFAAALFTPKTTDQRNVCYTVIPKQTNTVTF